jgi:hypothetical protein
MNEELAAALEPVRRDLVANCAVVAEFREAPGDFGVDQPGVWVLEPDGTGIGISVVPGEGLTDQVAGLADQVQEWAVEALWSAGLPAVWPECPLHPDSHPLAVGVENEVAVWSCPRTDTVIVPVGELPAKKSTM